MILLDKVRFDFQVQDEGFARNLYGKWDDFCRTSFVQVADSVLSGFERPQEMIYVEKLDIDLGVIHEEDFYTAFPRLLEENLKNIFKEYLSDPERHGGRVITTGQGCLEWISYYFLHGCLRWDTPEELRSPAKLFSEVMKGEREGLSCFLQRERHLESLRRRLVMQFDDDTIEAVISLTEQHNAKFICTYARFMIASYPCLLRPGIIRREYREALWLLVLAYLWSENKGTFSRKQLVKRTIEGLAAHYGMDFYLLLGLLMQGVKEDMIHREEGQGLLYLLSELGREDRGPYSVSVERQELWIAYLKGHAGEGINEYPGKSGDMRSFLSSPQACRKFLSLLTEPEIEKLVRLVMPEEGDYIVLYAHRLEKEKEQGMFEGKAGGEFRLVKWEFIFTVLSEFPASGFDRKCFAERVLRHLAGHYGLNYIDLIGYFYREKDFLPEKLRSTVTELYRELAGNIFSEVISERPVPGVSEEGRAQLIRILSHPLSCRSFLSRLEEEKIFRLVHIVLPAESRFIEVYARRLEQEKERGMFEGKAGTDFRIIKWEFIFLAAFSGSSSHKYMVASVLQQLSAHYGLDYSGLLDYFYRHLPQEYPELQTVITELWQEGRNRETLPQLALLDRELREIRMLESFLATGIPGISPKELHTFFVALSESAPNRLLETIRRSVDCCWVDCPHINETYGYLYASVILWYIRRQNVRFPGYMALLPLLEAVVNGKAAIGVAFLRRLLAGIVNGREQEVLTLILSGGSLPDKPVCDADIAYVRYLLSHCEAKQIGDFIREHKTLFRKIFFSSSEILREVILLTEHSGKVFIFLCKLYGEKAVTELIARNGGGSHGNRSLLQHLAENRVLQDVIFVMEGALLGDAGVLQKEWQDMSLAGQKQVISSFAGHRQLQRLWIYRNGSVVLRKVFAELMWLQRRLPFYLDEDKLLNRLTEYTLRSYGNFSEFELFAHFWEFLLALVDDRQLQIMNKILADNASGYSGFLAVKNTSQNKTIARTTIINTSDNIEEKLFYINNAGLVLLSPWFPMLFEKLDLLKDKKEFTGAEAQIRAIFLLQSLLFRENEFEEHTLLLNKILTGWESDDPLPLAQERSVQERELPEEMLKGVLQNWDKLKNTSVDGFRQSFLAREGKLDEKEDSWVLTVDERGYDVLLDSVPWGYKFVKYPWMKKPLNVIWR